MDLPKTYPDRCLPLPEGCSYKQCHSDNRLTVKDKSEKEKIAITRKRFSPVAVSRPAAITDEADPSSIYAEKTDDVDTLLAANSSSRGAKKTPNE
jgi:hypothetical protein